MTVFGRLAAFPLSARLVVYVSMIVGSAACSPPPVVPRAARTTDIQSASPLGPSYVLLPVAVDDDTLLGRILLEPPGAGRSFEETAKPNPCAQFLSEPQTNASGNVFENAEELAKGGFAKALLVSFGFAFDVGVATHFSYKLETVKRRSRTDTTEYAACCKEKGCGYGFVSALLYGTGDYATAEETKASGSVELPVAGNAGGYVRARILHKQRQQGYIAALVHVTGEAPAEALSPLGIAKAAGIVTEAALPESVKRLYDLDVLKVSGTGPGYILVDGRGSNITENEFVRRYDAVTGSNELADFDRRRNTGRLVVSGALFAASAAMVAVSATQLFRYCRPDDAPRSSLPNYDACKGDQAFGGYTDQFGVITPSPRSAIRPFTYNRDAKVIDGGWAVALTASSIAALGSGIWFAVELFGERDGSAADHQLLDSDATLFVERYNRALLKKTVDDIRRSRAGNSLWNSFRIDVGIGGFNLTGQF